MLKILTLGRLTCAGCAEHPAKEMYIESTLAFLYHGVVNLILAALKVLPKSFFFFYPKLLALMSFPLIGVSTLMYLQKRRSLVQKLEKRQYGNMWFAKLRLLQFFCYVAQSSGTPPDLDNSTDGNRGSPDTGPETPSSGNSK